LTVAQERPLGRREPTDFEHVAKYPFGAVAPATVATVERTLALPSWHWTHDQGREGSCVGHGTTMERAIVNIAQARAAGVKPFTRRYNPLHVWNEAKLIDEWPDTNPGDSNGTSVRAAYDVLRVQGAMRVRSMKLVDGNPQPVGGKLADVAEGVLTNRWATTVDEVRTALSQGLAVAIGVNWYGNFDTPVQKGSEWWIGEGDFLSLRGGHCTVLYGASDKRQAFRMKNSWGRSYPLVWMPYGALGRLLAEDGEVALVTDR
jgi:hypothetical protein